jgi:hypothetical protein
MLNASTSRCGSAEPIADTCRRGGGNLGREVLGDSQQSPVGQARPAGVRNCDDIVANQQGPESTR